MSSREEAKRRAQALYVPKSYGYRRIARELGIPPGTVRRWVVPGKAEADRRAARERKRQRVGVCERCGGQTRYNGRTAAGPSRICATCATAPRTHCKRGHELTPDNVVHRQKGERLCRTCRRASLRASARRWYQRHHPERAQLAAKRAAEREAAREQLREQARAMYRRGEFGHVRVARALGVSASTVRRLVDDEYLERERDRLRQRA